MFYDKLIMISYGDYDKGSDDGGEDDNDTTERVFSSIASGTG